MTKRKHNFRRMPLRNRLIMWTAVWVFGLAGIAYLAATSAVTYSVPAEAESGQLSGSAVASDDGSGASGDASVKFQAAAVVPPPTPTPPPAGSILFEDDFNGTSGSLPNAAKWGEWSNCSYHGAYGNINCGVDERLDGSGHLTVPASPTEGSSLTTGDRFKFLYGTMSAWIKFPVQSGYWPAFWSLNAPFTGADILPGGEADVMEGYTHFLTAYHAIGHNWTGNGATDSGSADPYPYCPTPIQPNLDLSAAYHKYSAKLEPNKITFYFDDHQCGEPFTPASNPGKTWGFGPNVTRGNWLILSLAVGGCGGCQAAPTAPAQMLVDRVEVRSN